MTLGSQEHDTSAGAIYPAATKGRLLSNSQRAAIGSRTTDRADGPVMTARLTSLALGGAATGKVWQERATARLRRLEIESVNITAFLFPQQIGRASCRERVF